MYVYSVNDVRLVILQFVEVQSVESASFVRTVCNEDDLVLQPPDSMKDQQKTRYNSKLLLCKALQAPTILCRDGETSHLADHRSSLTSCQNPSTHVPAAETGGRVRCNFGHKTICLHTPIDNFNNTCTSAGHRTVVNDKDTTAMLLQLLILTAC